MQEEFEGSVPARDPIVVTAPPHMKPPPYGVKARPIWYDGAERDWADYVSKELEEFRAFATRMENFMSQLAPMLGNFQRLDGMQNELNSLKMLLVELNAFSEEAGEALETMEGVVEAIQKDLASHSKILSSISETLLKVQAGRKEREI